MGAETSNPGPPKDRKSPKLVLLGRRGAAYLVLPVSEDSTITVRLSRRHVNVLLALNDLLIQEEEEEFDEAACGWMTDHEIASAVAGIGVAPEAHAISAYRSQIKRLIAGETPDGSDAPPLLETEREVGVRLVRKINVIDAPRRFGRP